jgi:hypothetical protein
MQRTAADHRLTRIDRGRLHLDEDLTGGGHRFRDVAYLQDVGLAIPIELHCLAHRGYDRERQRVIPAVHWILRGNGITIFGIGIGSAPSQVRMRTHTEALPRLFAMIAAEPSGTPVVLMP